MNFSPESAASSVRVRRSEDLELAYDTDFRQLLRRNPSAISDFHKIEDEVSAVATEAYLKGNSLPMYNGHYEEGVVTVDLLDAVGSTEAIEEGPGGLAEYMKVSIEGSSFFVKRVAGYPFEQERSLGVREFQSLQKAAELIKDLPNVEVVEFKFAYQSEKEGIHVTYFVSKWIDDAMRLDLYLDAHYNDTDDSRNAGLRKRYQDIHEILGGEFHDVLTHNMMYSESSDKIIIFDIHRQAGEK